MQNQKITLKQEFEDGLVSKSAILNQGQQKIEIKTVKEGCRMTCSEEGKDGEDCIFFELDLSSDTVVQWHEAISQFLSI